MSGVIEIVGYEKGWNFALGAVRLNRRNETFRKGRGLVFVLVLGYRLLFAFGFCLAPRGEMVLAEPLAPAGSLSSPAALLPSPPAHDDAGRNLDSTDVLLRLFPVHRLKVAPGPYDWLAVHSEPGQDFSDYTASSPVLPDALRHVIYIVLIGDFDAERTRILEETAEFIRAYYTLPVKFLPAIGNDAVPAEARRVHPQTGDPQILTTYVIESLLKPLKPDDAFCLIGFASQDLWPGEGWNFVFGQASLPDRVGVWSIYRNGDPQESLEARKVCLLRTIKTGVHEIGHMFSMHHCIFFECNMNGSNHRMESDARPVWLCPVCLRKLMWGLNQNPVRWFEALMEVCGRLGLKEEEAFYSRSIRALVEPH
ncbi:MAG TPA: archaemetzincin [Candidatus Omnitrophota bacterium]|nr:hypothetical protein [Candidatus Omnitrophota bacterium]HQO57140.1 archaemetzincin [Candidatus Omnitrophota bacterium]HQP11654.1 archaemetzincin [Candidatus Omnitrophota bacterium]